MSKHLAFVGTYADQSYGIPAISVDSDSGELSLLNVNRGIEKPSYLQVSADGRRLYCSVWREEFADRGGGGGLAAYAIEGSELSFLNARPVFASPPCYVKTDRNEKYLYAANYREGTAVAYALQPDGQLGGEPICLQHTGRGPHPTRQEKAHIHCVELPPAENLLYVVDLGLDIVKAYLPPSAGGQLQPVPEADLRELPGAGPRHIVFSADAHFAYLANELSSTVSVWDIREPRQPKHLQMLSLLPATYQGENTAAAIKLSSDGRRLCCSNRGHDSVAVFAVETATGMLSLLAISPTLGRGPRDFAFVPGERFIVVAHQYTDNLLSLHFDYDSGRLTPIPGPFLTLAQQPVCVKFL